MKISKFCYKKYINLKLFDKKNARNRVEIISSINYMICWTYRVFYLKRAT